MIAVGKISGKQKALFDVFFDNTSPAFNDGNPVKNLEFIIKVLNTSNRIVNTRGYLYLYEVFRMLELPKEIIEETKKAKVGWVKNKYFSRPVDFDIFNRKRNNEFLSGWEDVILLKFNIDGVIRNGFLC